MCVSFESRILTSCISGVLRSLGLTILYFSGARGRETPLEDLLRKPKDQKPTVNTQEKKVQKNIKMMLDVDLLGFLVETTKPGGLASPSSPSWVVPTSQRPHSPLRAEEWSSHLRVRAPPWTQEHTPHTKGLAKSTTLQRFYVTTA